jgi:hypothetical protein
MPMDEYDLSHTINFKKVINIYSNYNQEQIDNIIKDYVEKDLNESKKNQVISLTDEINQVIKRLKTNLKVIDNRHITNVGARIINNEYSTYNKDFGRINTWTLVQVWRGIND